MKERKFRKIHINWLRQRIVNQRPWMVAGWLLAVAFLLLAILLYLSK